MKVLLVQLTWDFPATKTNWAVQSQSALLMWKHVPANIHYQQVEPNSGWVHTS